MSQQDLITARWDTKFVEFLEQILVIKTEDCHVEALINYVKENQTYQVPGIISIKIDEGNTKYLTWIKQITLQAAVQNDL
ncbi:3828_t:CDS:2 [Ambispora gerdemannii]|uniref:3828_t:CDS:1 n=1 Tax=Ambispora gerdemannii TaxID=144530 RepID=A0A9N9H536_9GLOM|nr:3828_t:CDS:2 [Ambispora gerdemannii]